MFDTACSCYSNETVTPRKHVTKYKNMRKWMVEFLRKFESNGIKIAELTRLTYQQIYQYTLILYIIIIIIIILNIIILLKQDYKVQLAKL